MTMTNDELRALADALDSDPARGMAVAADYLRAQADAQPVAKIERVAAGAIALFKPDGGPFDMSKYVGASLYTHPAPAAPHYAMLDSHRRLVEQAIQSAEHPSGMSTHDGKAHIDASILRRMLAIIDSLSAAPQAEPKREPRPCTCHPDDNPPVPCAQKYALNECRATRSGSDEALILAEIERLDRMGGSDAE